MRVLSLVDSVPPVQPPPGLWYGLEARIIDGRGALLVRRRAPLAPALAAGAAAALAAGLALYHHGSAPPPLPIPMLPPDSIPYIESHALVGRSSPLADRIGFASYVTAAGQEYQRRSPDR